MIEYDKIDPALRAEIEAYCSEIGNPKILYQEIAHRATRGFNCESLAHFYEVELSLVEKIASANDPKPNGGIEGEF